MIGNSGARRVQASIVMVDGSTRVGSVTCGASGRLESVLLTDAPFIEFQPDDGDMGFLAKGHIISVTPIKASR
jgi:hypothetical protein